MNTRNNQLARLHILLNEQGVDNDTKCEIYASYGVGSSKDMTDYQLRHLIARLEGHDLGPAPTIQARQDVSSETRRLRSQCLKLITGSPAPANPKLRGLGIPNDWTIINPFVQYHAGARLNQLSDSGLADFVKKLRKIRDSGWFYRSPQPGAEPPRQTAPVAPVLVIPTNNNTIN